MFVTILIVLAAAVAALLAFAATRPDAFTVQRSATIAAPAGRIFPHLDDFHRWSAWSPWEKLDPAMKRDFSGAPSGTGAEYHWSGNSDVGEGQMTITDSRPPQSVTIRLEFLKPFAATSTTQFDFAPSGAGTNVTWTMNGHNNFMAKAFSAFMDMDKMIGADFEKGLAGLDAATVAARRQ